MLLVLGVEEEALLVEAVLVTADVAHGDDGEAHLSRPRVHDEPHVVLAPDRLPQHRHTPD